MADVDNQNKVNGYPDYNNSNHPKTSQKYNLYKDDLDFTESDKSGLSYGNGTSPEEYALSQDRTFNDVRDPNTDIFRYGLWYDLYSNVEDPTLLGFTCEIDDSENSPLFGTGPNSAAAFIEKYSGMPEVGVRDRILQRFQKNIKMLFKSMESIETKSTDFPYVKSHYLEKVVGLKALSNKFTKYKEDNLAFTMHEDVTMFAQYLAQLYNNLAYSYRSGKMIIPENLLRFNLTIKITEIRNFKTIVRELTKDSTPEDTVRKLINVNSSQLRYTLYDCNFDFFESQNHGDDMQMSSMGGSVTSTANMDFKLFFKNVTRYFKSEIIDDLRGDTNSRTDLDDYNYNPRIFVDSTNFFRVPESQPDFDIDRNPANDTKRNPGPSKLQDLKTSVNPTQSDKNRNLQSPGGANNNIFNGNTGKESIKKLINKEKQNLLNNLELYKEARIKDVELLKQTLLTNVNKGLDNLKAGLAEKFRRNRAELLNQLLYEIKDDIDYTIYPENVYDQEFKPNSKENVIKDLKTNVYDNIEDFIRGFNQF